NFLMLKGPCGRQAVFEHLRIVSRTASEGRGPSHNRLDGEMVANLRVVEDLRDEFRGPAHVGTHRNSKFDPGSECRVEKTASGNIFKNRASRTDIDVADSFSHAFIAAPSAFVMKFRFQSYKTEAFLDLECKLVVLQAGRSRVQPIEPEFAFLQIGVI